MPLGKPTELGETDIAGRAKRAAQSPIERELGKFERQIIQSESAWRLASMQSLKGLNNFIKAINKASATISNIKVMREMGVAGPTMTGAAQRRYASLMARAGAARGALGVSGLVGGVTAAATRAEEIRRREEEAGQKRFEEIRSRGQKELLSVESRMSKLALRSERAYAQKKEQDDQERKDNEAKIQQARDTAQKANLKFWQESIKQQDQLRARDRRAAQVYQKQLEQKRNILQRWLNGEPVQGLAMPGAAEGGGMGGRGGGGTYVATFGGRGRYGRHIGRILQGLGRGGFEIGEGAMLGLGIVGLLGALGVGAYELYGAGNKAVRRIRPDLERIYGAGRVTRMTGSSLQGFLGGVPNAMGISPYLARNFGYTTQAEAADVLRAYGGPFRATAAFGVSSVLGNSALTAFQGPEAWARFLGRTTGLGMNLGPLGMEKSGAVLRDAFEQGAKKALPPPQVFENMNRLLATIVSTGTIMSMGDLARLATRFAGSALPTLRTGAAIGGAMETYKGQMTNILGMPLRYNEYLMSLYRTTGTFTPTGSQYEKFLHKTGLYKGSIPKKMKEYIDTMRFRPFAVEHMVANALGINPLAVENVGEKTLYTSFRKAGYSEKFSRAMSTYIEGVTGGGGAATYHYATRLGTPGVPGTIMKGTEAAGAAARVLLPGTTTEAMAGPRLDLKTGAIIGDTTRRLLYNVGGPLGSARAITAREASKNLEEDNAALKTFGERLNSINNYLYTILTQIEAMFPSSTGISSPGTTGPHASPMSGSRFYKLLPGLPPGATVSSEGADPAPAYLYRPTP